MPVAIVVYAHFFPSSSLLAYTHVSESSLLYALSNHIFGAGRVILAIDDSWTTPAESSSLSV
jgi:hypothetical protein